MPVIKCILQTNGVVPNLTIGVGLDSFSTKTFLLRKTAQDAQLEERCICYEVVRGFGSKLTRVRIGQCQVTLTSKYSKHLITLPNVTTVDCITEPVKLSAQPKTTDRKLRWTTEPGEVLEVQLLLGADYLAFALHYVIPVHISDHGRTEALVLLW